MDWTALLTAEMDNAYETTFKMLDLLQDDDLDWKPATGENWMTVGQLLAHVASACGMCCQGFVTGEWGLPDGGDEGEDQPAAMLPTAAQMPTVADLAAARAALTADRDLAVKMVAQAGAEKLATVKLAAPWEPGSQRLLGHHLLQMVQHLAIHKAQLFYYLKLMGHRVDSATLWGI